MPTTDARAAAEWIIGEIIFQSKRSDQPLTQYELESLRKPMWQFTDRERAAMVALNNKVVMLAREAMEHAKRAGAATVKVRRGLTIPNDWAMRYDIIYATNFPWAVAGIMQNAMLANPLANERRPWRSK